LILFMNDKQHWVCCLMKCQDKVWLLVLFFLFPRKQSWLKMLLSSRKRFLLKKRWTNNKTTIGPFVCVCEWKLQGYLNLNEEEERR
jgi:hypothetical protein